MNSYFVTNWGIIIEEKQEAQQLCKDTWCSYFSYVMSKGVYTLSKQMDIYTFVIIRNHLKDFKSYRARSW